ncbi:MAG TPA: hypothetical protein VG755_36400 [Nannocystaceae bacterium]|nr:hypothetical protein [Nannocystaceae bacterium]
MIALRHTPRIAVLVALAGCGEPDDGSPCGEQTCEVASSKAELLAELDGFGDPVAAWLRAAANDAGAFAGDYDDALSGVRAELGCDAADEHSFVVLSNAGYAPKAIVAQCTSAPSEASRFFTVFEPDAGGDLDPERFRFAAWDPDASAFRRYQAVPTEHGIGFAVEPQFCASCHGGPYGLAAWAPIMNEMTNPWAQWNAEPGFASFEFAEHLPDGHDGPIYRALTAEGRLDSASNLEPIVRAAIDRTTAARVAERTAAPALAEAAALLRPVFCDESANYVSEIHESGELAQAAALDPGLRRMYGLVSPGAPFAFLADDVLHIEPPDPDATPLVMIGVRGETTVQLEAALVSRGVLAPLDVLRVRALDWTHPVASELRCGLLDDALADADVDPAAFADTAALASALFERALVLPSGRSLADAGAGLYALADADDEAARDVLLHGEPIAIDLAALGAAIDEHLADLPRAAIDAERARRGCALRSKFPTAPIIPGVTDVPEACPAGGPR